MKRTAKTVEENFVGLFRRTEKIIVNSGGRTLQYLRHLSRSEIQEAHIMTDGFARTATGLADQRAGEQSVTMRDALIVGRL